MRKQALFGTVKVPSHRGDEALGFLNEVEGAAVLRRFDRLFMAPQLQPTPYSSAAAELVPRLLLAG
jgi:hypothetical protein